MSRWAFIRCLTPAPTAPPVVLAEALMALSSAVSMAADGVWLEVGRSQRLFGGDRGLAKEAVAIADRASCTVAVAIADRPETARILARVSRRPLLIVAPGHDAEALASLPLEAFSVGPQALAYLDRLGVRTAGALSRLSPKAVRRRLGPDGERLVRLARADGLPLPERYVPPDLPMARRELEPPIPPSEAVLFLVKTVLDELAIRLSGRGLAVAALRLAVIFEDGSVRTEEVLLPRPLRTTPPLLAILQERLAGAAADGGPQVLAPLPSSASSADWPARMTAVEAQVLRTAEAPKAQLDMFSREELDAEELTTLLARLTNTLGQDKVFAAELVPTHRPEAAWRRTRYAAPPERKEVSQKKPKALHVHEHEEPPAPRPILVLPSPLPVEGELSAGSELRWRGGGGSIRTLWGPERLRGQWWSAPFDRDYHVVDLEGGARIWVFRDKRSQALYLQGVFD